MLHPQRLAFLFTAKGWTNTVTSTQALGGATKSVWPAGPSRLGRGPVPRREQQARLELHSLTRWKDERENKGFVNFVDRMEVL